MLFKWKYGTAKYQAFGSNTAWSSEYPEGNSSVMPQPMPVTEHWAGNLMQVVTRYNFQKI